MAKKTRLVKIKKNGEVEIFSSVDNAVAGKATRVSVADGDRLCMETTDGEVIENIKVTREGNALTVAAANDTTQQFVLDGYFNSGLTDVEFVGPSGQLLFSSADAYAMHTLLPGQSASYIGHAGSLAPAAGGDTTAGEWPSYAMPLAIAGGIGVAALAFGGGGGGGGSGSGGGATAPAGNTVQGAFAAGPAVAGQNMEVSIYDKAGKLIKSTRMRDDGTFDMDLGSYTGLAIVRVDGKGGAADYQDEVSRVATNLNAGFLAVINIATGVNKMSINPLTAVAAKMMGLDVVNGELDSSKFEFDAGKVADKNAEVAKAFGLGSDVTKLVVETVVDKNGEPQPSNQAGVVLAALSGMDAIYGGMQATINSLAKKVGRPLDQSILDEALMMGAAAADAKLQFSDVLVIDVMSNILNATNSSDGYSISSIAKDNVIDKDDLFKVGSEITFKVPPGKLAGDFEMWLPGNSKGAGTITINASTNIASYALTAAEANELNTVSDGLKRFQVKAAGSTDASPALTVRDVFVDREDNAPIAINFSNVVNSLAEATITGGKKVADIVIADLDGYTGDVPTVSDASNFEVKKVAGGKYELWLKSGVVLDFESDTKSLTTTVSAGGVDSAAFTLTLTDVNEAPATKGSIPAQTAIKNFAFSLDTANFFKDMDTGDVLTYAVTGGTLPAGFSLDPTTGLISGTPDADKAPISVTIKATDKAGLSVSQTFDLGVVTTALALASESDSGVKGDGITKCHQPSLYWGGDSRGQGGSVGYH